MSNWFESSPARSVIIHTLLVGTAVWASFEFIFDENKVALYKAQTEQFKAKTEFLEVEVSRLRDENQKYLEWMKSTPNTIPFLEGKIAQLTEENARLKRNSLIGTPTTNPLGGSLVYSAVATVGMGDTYVDSETLATLGVTKISPDFSADVTVTLPGQASRTVNAATPGVVWPFEKNGINYQLILVRVNWYSNHVVASVREIAVQKK